VVARGTQQGHITRRRQRRRKLTINRHATGMHQVAGGDYGVRSLLAKSLSQYLIQCGVGVGALQILAEGDEVTVCDV